ncbi:MAG TPA: hypothetical protein VM243_01725 [Phycisphaerae bacterium]|nr:hypothetical protein [Phycisphaerae bacterium]
MSSIISSPRRSWSSLLVVGLVVSVAGSVVAAPRAWTNATGSNSTFGWSGGQSGDGDVTNVGLWGDPIVNDEGFFFRDMNPLFKAEAVWPASSNMLSGMSVTLNTMNAVPPNMAGLTELRVREWGSYTGDIEDVVATGGTVLLTPISPGGPPTNLGELAMTFDSQEGTWEASMDVVFSDIGGGFPSAVQIMSMAITNHLEAIPMDGSASIQKEGASVVFPEPATGMLTLCGLIAVARRRGRHNSR